MASIVLLLSELLGGESASVLAADRYIMGGGRLGLVEVRPAAAAAESSPSPAAKRDGRPVGGQQRAAAGTEGAREEKEESFEDLAVSRIAVDAMWP